ncbi:MAG: hypothetical protein J7M05_13320 [Anaerolineae bacterium]|nr:hypothetical protein [Anaerolineae bacterium]
MGLLKKLLQFFGGGTAGSARGSSTSRSDPYGLWFYFRCNKCGAVVRVRADKRNDLNREEGGPGVFLYRKEVMDDKCFQLMRADIWLDSHYNVVSAEVQGGELITEEEYEAAKAAAQEKASTPPTPPPQA